MLVIQLHKGERKIPSIMLSQRTIKKIEAVGLCPQSYNLLDRQLNESLKVEVWDGFGGFQRNTINSWQTVKPLKIALKWKQVSEKIYPKISIKYATELARKIMYSLSFAPLDSYRITACAASVKVKDWCP